MAAALRRTRARAPYGRRPSLTTTPSVWITSLQPLRSRRPRLLRLTGRRQSHGVWDGIGCSFGPASPAVTVTLRNGTPTGSVIATRTDNASGGIWSVSFNSPPTAPGTYCVVSVATDVAGNIQDPGSFQCWTIAAADGTEPFVTLSLPTPPPGQASYFNATQVPVTGSVSAVDPSGITAINCTDSASGLTLGPLISNSRTVTINGNGTHNISCTATDGAGNSGAASGSSNTEQSRLTLMRRRSRPLPAERLIPTAGTTNPSASASSAWTLVRVTTSSAPPT